METKAETKTPLKVPILAPTEVEVTEVVVNLRPAHVEQTAYIVNPLGSEEEDQDKIYLPVGHAGVCALVAKLGGALRIDLQSGLIKNWVTPSQEELTAIFGEGVV